MLAGYPSAKDVQGSYVGLMASIFSRYPRSVVLAAVEPDGIPLTTRFVPTPADVISWLQKKTEPMHQDAAREDRIEKQFAAREESYRSPLDEARRKRIADAWLDRTDPAAKELGLKPTIITEEDREALAEDARKAGAKIYGMKLKPETLAVLRAQDAMRDHLTEDKP